MNTAGARFHHINLVSQNLERMSQFYKDALELQEIQKARMYEAPATFLASGENELHLSIVDPNLGFRVGHLVNPVGRGHIAFRVDDIERTKEVLERQAIPYSDYGEWAIEGWYQLYLCDPEGNVIEVHQVMT